MVTFLSLNRLILKWKRVTSFYVSFKSNSVRLWLPEKDLSAHVYLHFFFFSKVLVWSTFGEDDFQDLQCCITSNAKLFTATAS